MRNYLKLCKLNVIVLMLVTSWVGMLLALPMLTLSKFVFATTGIALVAASSAVINHIVDKSLDKKMQRTFKRPVAQGQISVARASMFAAALFVGGSLILFFKVNTLTLWLTIFAMVGYALFYSIWLKHQTPQNIVIGGIAGALPPVLGYTAVTNSIGTYSLLLTLIIFVWTPPHFWALAIFRFEDYKQAKLPMLPVTHGINFTKLNILLYSILLVVVSLLPVLVGFAGLIYLAINISLNIYFLFKVIQLYFAKDIKPAIRAFNASIWYLLLLFLGVIIDYLFYLGIFL